MNITAKLIVKEDTKTYGESFNKREFVVEFAENPEYPEFIKFELIQDKCESLNQFNLGDSISIAFNLKGRKWTNPKGDVVYFNSLQAWRLEKDNGTHDLTPSHDQAIEDSTADDLPF